MENSSFLDQIEATNRVPLSGFYDRKTRSLNLLQNSLSSVGFDGYIPTITQEVYLYDKYNGRINILPGQYILIRNDSYEDSQSSEDAEFCQVVEVRKSIRATQFLGSQITNSILNGYDQFGNELEFIPGEETITLYSEGSQSNLVLDTDYEYVEGFEGQSIKLLTEIDSDATIIIIPETEKIYYGSVGEYTTDESFPLFLLDENGDFVLDEFENQIPILDEEGNQVFEDVAQPDPEFTATVYIDYVDKYGLIKTLIFYPEEDTSLFPTHKIIISREVWDGSNIEFNYFYSDLEEGKISGEDQSGVNLSFIPGQESVVRIRSGEEQSLSLDSEYEYVVGEEGLSILLIGEQLEGDKYVISSPYQFSKSIGSRGWHLSSEGNAILNNIAVRGRIDALEGNFEGYLTVADGEMKIGRSVSEGESSDNSGIFIDPFNFWYDDGSFRVGSVNNYLNWDSNTLNIKGNITAGTIGSNWKISANRIEAGTGADYVALSTSVNGQLVRADFEEALIKNLIIDRQEINGLYYTTLYLRVEFADLIELMKSVLPDEFSGYDELSEEDQISLLQREISLYFLDKTFIFKNNESKINLPDTPLNTYLSALANRYLKIDRANIYKATLNLENQAGYTDEIIEDNVVFQFSGDDYSFDAVGTEEISSWTDETISLPSEINFKIINRSVTDNVVTIVTAEEHGFSPEDIITVSRVDAKFNGTYKIIDVPTATTLTFEKFSIDVPEFEDEINGLVSKNNGSYLIWAGDPQPDLAPFSVESSGNVNISDLFTSNKLDVVTLIQTGGLKINGYQTFVSSTTPAEASEGDIWIKNLSGPELYKYDGDSWIGGSVDLTGYATETYVEDAISNLIDSAPSTLDTLNELAAALGDDENFATTITTSLGTKAPIVDPVFTNSIEVKGQLRFDVTDGTPGAFINFATIPGLYSSLDIISTDIVFFQSVGDMNISSQENVFISGTSGEYIGTASPNNQIATIGDLSSYAPLASPTLTGTTTVTNIKATSTYSGGSPAAQTTEYAHTPTGIVNPFAGSSAPTGWLLCSGQTVSRTTYAALFAVIGTTYNTGGEAGTEFRIPNLKGKIPVGLDSSQTEFDGLGETGGSKTSTAEHTHGIDHNHPAFNATSGNTSQNHSHGFDLNIVHSDGTPVYGEILNVGIYLGNGVSRYFDGTGGQSADHTHTTTIDVPNLTGTSGASSAGVASGNLQPYTVMNYIIKY
jgi:microcystin-dependent protein